MFQGPIERLFREAIEVLSNAASTKHCLVGGLAIALRSSERTTKDVDLALSVANDKHAEDILRVFIGRGFRITALLENKRHQRISTARLALDEDGTILDLLFSACGIEAEVVDTATSLEIFPGLFFPVASVSALLAMKILSADMDLRLQDIIDIRGILEHITEVDLSHTRALLKLIQSRGYAREKDLLSDLDEYIRKQKSDVD